MSFTTTDYYAYIIKMGLSTLDMMNHISNVSDVYTSPDGKDAEKRIVVTDKYGVVYGISVTQLTENH